MPVAAKNQKKDRKVVAGVPKHIEARFEKAAAWPGKRNPASKRVSATIATREHAKIVRAAELTGVSLDRFVADAVRRSADEILDDERRHRQLTNTDAEFLISLKENPLPLNERLLRALRENKRTSRG